jgi:site-specific recombinase XerD
MSNLEGRLKKTELSSVISTDGIPVSKLRRYAEGWLLDCDIRQLSRNTITTRRIILDKLFWFLNDREYDTCAKPELQQFFHYLRNGHESGDGRWSNANLKRSVRPSTSDSYFRILRTFFKYLVDDEVIDSSPMDRMSRPIVRTDQVQPFTAEQITALRALQRTR